MEILIVSPKIVYELWTDLIGISHRERWELHTKYFGESHISITNEFKGVNQNILCKFYIELREIERKYGNSIN